MAEKISVQIALNGGAEIEKQLADIGDAGQKAFIDISKAAEQAGGFNNLKPEEVTKKLQDMGVTGVDAIKKIQAAVQSAGRLESIVQGVQKAEAAFSALASVALKFGGPIAAGIALATTQVKAFAEEVTKANAEALKLGLNIGKFDQLRLGFEAAGISAKAISAGLAQVAGDINKLQLQQVTRDFEAFKNISGAGTQEIQRLQAAAKKFTPAGKAAAEALVKLGVGIPNTTFRDIQDLGVELAKLKGLTGVNFQVDDDLSTRIAKIVEAVRRIPDAAQRSAVAAQLLGSALGAELVQAINTGSVAVDQFKDRLGGLTQAQVDTAAAVEQSQNRAAAAWRRFDFSGFASDVVNLGKLLASIEWDAFSSAAVTAWNWIAGAVVTAAERVGEFFRSLGEVVTKPIDGAWQWITDTFNSAMSGLSTALDAGKQLVTDWVTTPIANAWQWIVDAWNAMLQKLGFGGGKSGAAAPAGAGGKSFASGGLLGGRGSGTSDSNLAWVSRGEYVVPARAVAQPGVLSLLETLRRGMGHFALGGMVGPVGIPAFAGGGMNHVSINFPGLPEINGLRAPSGVVDELRKAAALAQVRSGGRKPSRFS